jgi:hypothetical protein
MKKLKKKKVSLIKRKNQNLRKRTKNTNSNTTDNYQKKKLRGEIKSEIELY